MNGETKFRAWDKKQKTMELYVTDLNNWHHCAATVTVDKISPREIEHDNCVLMQCTGLHDKNTEEIYFDCSVMKYGDALFIVEMYDTEYGFVCPSIKWLKGNREWSYSEWAYDHAGDCEIIGNIYENPELLEGGN